MTVINGWARVAQGLHLVTANGAARILASSADVSSNIATRHLPELIDSIVKATVAMQQQNNNRQSVVRESAQQQQQQPTGGSDDLAVSLNQPLSSLRDVVGSREPQLQTEQKEISSKSRITDIITSIEQSYEVKHSNNGKDDKEEEKEVPKTSINVNDVELQNSTGTSTIALSSAQYNPTNEAVSKNSVSIDSNYNDDNSDNDTQPLLPEGSAIPTSRISRAFGFATLGAGLALGSITELARRTFDRTSNNNSKSSSSSGDSLILSNNANAERLTNSLRRMRGAAMKLGQMLSIQDESIAPPALTAALENVRRGAEAMPQYQLMQQLDEQWGSTWRDRIVLEDRPFAAASIGQVHRGTLLSPQTLLSTTNSTGGSIITKVAVKVQYPGVADSIESDLSNLSMLLSALAPPGLFLDNIIRVGREELKVECNYRREATNQKRFQTLLSSDPSLVADRFIIPNVIDELCTDRILVTELVRGGTIDKVINLDQMERNRIGLAIMRLTMLELFVWRFMQTDPNWGNFLYDVRTRTTYLIDFGASREFSEDFVRGYLNIVIANANCDKQSLIEESIRMGFLTGKENDVMLEAHTLSGFCLGEPFATYEPYDFKSSRITSRISEHGAVFLKHRLTPPPEEVYTLHRKLAGAYNLCIKLGAKISCRSLLDEVAAIYKK
jgi:aarF domain-containing kinase